MEITKKEFFKALDESIEMYKYDNLYFPKRFSFNGYTYILESDKCRKIPIKRIKLSGHFVDIPIETEETIEDF